MSINIYPKILLEEVNEGFVLIDTLLTKELSEEAKKDFNRIAGLDKEVIAVFYTHWHADHWAGVKAWITEKDARSGKVDVIAQDLFEGGLIAENLISGVAMSRRAQYMYATRYLYSSVKNPNTKHQITNKFQAPNSNL